MSNLNQLQDRLRTMDCQGILIPSSDEYLSEFAQPSAQRLGWVTGFGGSTGLAVVLVDRAALFVDSRYQSQGVRDTAGLGIEVLDYSETVRFRWLADHLRTGQRLAIDTRLHPHPDVEQILRFTAEYGIVPLEVMQNPIDELWDAARPHAISSTIVDYPVRFAGSPADEKCAKLQRWLKASGAECHLLADPEDAAWLLNVRTHDSLKGTQNGWHIVPIPLSRVLVETGKVYWFIERARLEPSLAKRLEGAVDVIDPGEFESILQERCRGKVLSANLPRTPHKYANIATKLGTLRDDPVVSHWRWRKQPNELARAREGHYRDGQAVIRFLAWVQRTVAQRVVTELEAAQKLKELRGEDAEYKGMSMPFMSASGPSGAMAHYIPSEQSNRKLNDHPIYWMDSGAQYYGCSTDNTVCIAVGKPDPRHIRAHTYVVKGFIALARARFPVGTSSIQLDVLARQPLWHAGMDYGHGTGHGVGNFMNIHEGPYMTKRIGHPMAAPMDVGMIVSNEPAYYVDGDFGIRIESHLETVQSQYSGFLEFETISRLPIDPRLIDDSLLTDAEQRWIVDYHRGIRDTYKDCFDQETAAWLNEIVDAYLALQPR
jgi:Xaa-Pro aminopeptidase